MEEVSGGPLGPFADLEVIRVEAGMSTARFCARFDMPERTWRRRQARDRAGAPPKGPWPKPVRHAARDAVLAHALAHPAWGHRKIWAMCHHDGHAISESTVLRLLRDGGLLLPPGISTRTPPTRPGPQSRVRPNPGRTESGAAARFPRVRNHLPHLERA